MYVIACATRAIVEHPTMLPRRAPVADAGA
jgi:hypothetical protein